MDATQDQYVRYESIASENRNASKQVALTPTMLSPQSHDSTDAASVSPTRREFKGSARQRPSTSADVIM